MKRVLTVLISLWLFSYFLVYAGVFRNNKDPFKVTKFYFECMKDSEWMLTYPITQTGYFDEKKLINDKEQIFDRVKIKHMEFRLVGVKERTAFVEAKLVCKNQRVIKSTVILERNNQNQWLIKDVDYN